MTRIDVEALRLAHLAALVTERGSYDAYRRARVAGAHALMAIGRTWDGTPERIQARVDLHVAGLAEHIASPAISRLCTSATWRTWRGRTHRGSNTSSATPGTPEPCRASRPCA